MKIEIPVLEDTNNTHSLAVLKITAGQTRASTELIYLEIDDDDRRIAVSKDTLQRALAALS